MLPQATSKITKSNSSIIQLQGINFSDNFGNGDMVDSKNISARRYPYISTRNPRQKLDNYTNVTNLSAHSELVVIEGTDVYYAGTKVPNLEVTEGEKQIVSINTKIVIFPDWKAIDLSGDSPTGTQYNPIDIDLPLKSYNSTSPGNHVKITSKGGYNYQCVIYHYLETTLSEQIFNTIDSNFSRNVNIGLGAGYTVTYPIKITSSLVKSVDYVSDYGNKRYEQLTFDFYATRGISAGSVDIGKIVIKSTMPDMDYICVHNNRVYGCSSKEQAIYASALGDPFEWNDFSGLSTDSYVVNVASPGNFEGCCSYSSSVLFWKQDRLHKLVGDYPAEYYMYTYDVEGLKAGAYKSLQIINETLYYMGINGVYAYTGSTPQLISQNFGNKNFTNAIAGTDGDTYYLSVMEGTTPYLMAYETRYGMWILEDHIRCNDFARIGKELYFLSNGNVYQMNAGSEDDIEWSFQFAPMYETIDGKKSYSRIVIRTELPRGSYIRVAVKTDDGLWVETAKIIGRNNRLSEVLLPINRCDKFELKLSGKGKMAILSILREYAIRSIK